VRVRKTRVEVEGEVREAWTVVDDEPVAGFPNGARLATVGHPVPRVEGRAKASGAARYTQDILYPGTLHARVLRSPHPHARVRALDAARALAMPGVRAVLSPFDPEVAGIAWHDGQGLLLDPHVRFRGEEVAVLVADSEEEAEDALAAIAVAYETLPAVFEPEAALAAGAPALHEGGNLLHGRPSVRGRGDIEAGWRAAEAVHEAVYRTPCALHHAFETHGALALWEGDRLLVHESTQHVYGARAEIAGALGLPLHRVRVVMDHMGGGFGAKPGASKQAVFAALLARRTGRPVRAVNDRREESLAAYNRSPVEARIRLGARKTGELTAIYLHARVNLGAYGTWAPPVAGPALGMYRCPNVRTEVLCAYTNLGPFGAFRGPGYVQGTFALERAMDELAATLGIDPLELRRRNFTAEDQEEGVPATACHLRECYDIAAKEIGWERRAALAAGNAKGGPIRRGMGCAAAVWGGGGGPPAFAAVRIFGGARPSVLVETGTQDLGTGTRTALAQIAAEVIGVAPAAVEVALGDTTAGPYAPISAGSMTLASVGPAVLAAAEDAVRQVRALAKDLGDEALPLPRVMERLGDFEVIGRGGRGPNPDGKAEKTYAAHMAEVEVDLRTGAVRVVKLAAVHDAGRVVNPVLFASQIEGGAIQGIGFALTEERVHDARLGVVLTDGLEKYGLPSAVDAPPPAAFRVAGVDRADRAANPLGAKGIGEPPLIASQAAIANAVAHAIGQARVRTLPIARRHIVAMGEV
jgi:xanthine dehydrogenase YagR molybdenum-binding subunit